MSTGVFRRRWQPYRRRCRRSTVWVTADALAVTSPAAYRVFQRSGTTGSIAISGTYTGTPTAIEASWNGGAYATIDAAPAGGTYSGTLSGQTQGQGTLTVRFTNDTGVTHSVGYVGIGEVIVTAGQSNSLGQGTNSQTYRHPTIKATKYTGSGWAEFADPYDGAGGSPWAWAATYLQNALGVPVAFLSCGADGASITTWTVGGKASYTAALARIQAAVGSGSGAVRCVVWHQGETDALAPMSEATYHGHLVTLVSQFTTDVPGVKFMPCLLQDSTGITDADEDAIRAATTASWADITDVETGPDFTDLTSTDSYHPKTDADQIVMGMRWADKLVEAFYETATGGGSGPVPMIGSPLIRSLQ